MEFYERVSGARMHAAFYRPNEVNLNAISSFIIEDILDFGADGMEVLLDGIAKEYEDNADELTNMDAKAISKHIREALALLKKRTSN